LHGADKKKKLEYCQRMVDREGKGKEPLSKNTKKGSAGFAGRAFLDM